MSSVDNHLQPSPRQAGIQDTSSMLVPKSTASPLLTYQAPNFGAIEVQIQTQPASPQNKAESPLTLNDLLQKPLETID